MHLDQLNIHVENKSVWVPNICSPQLCAKLSSGKSYENEIFGMASLASLHSAFTQSEIKYFMLILTPNDLT